MNPKILEGMPRAEPPEEYVMQFLKDIYHEAAEAQLKKVWEWGMEECPHFLHIHRYRCQCPECWETLRQEAGKE